MQTKEAGSVFQGFGAKRLKPVEVDPRRSNQHEFNGVRQFSTLFKSDARVYVNARFSYLTDELEEHIEESGTLTWYNAREADVKRNEYRLYFTSNTVMRMAMPEDLLIIAKKASDESFVVMVARAGSSIESQLLWLFGFDEQDLSKFYVQTLDPVRLEQVQYSTEIVLRNLGFELPPRGSYIIDQMVEKYANGFPVTAEFSSEIFKYLTHNNSIDSIGDPDHAIKELMATEESCFKAIESIIVTQKLNLGFTSVEDFISYSLSVQNRRKSRAGHALQNHLGRLFHEHKLSCDSQLITEGKSKPDFIFPGGQAYHNALFPLEGLTMLGVKTSCKDRWRQILAEAERIKNKHLFTLQPALSTNQLEEMQRNHVSLVLPLHMMTTYPEAYHSWMITLKEFISMVASKQRNFK
jgi:EcoRII C terminal